MKSVMRIVIADYSGHSFQVQLSRELARLGHFVLHLHFAEFQTPKGKLQVSPGDPPSLTIEAISIGKAFAKNNFIKRRSQEITVGKAFVRRMLSFRPDVVIGCNLPLDPLNLLNAASLNSGIPFIFWQQDIYSLAIAQLLKKKYGFAGSIIGRHYKSIEAAVLRSSTAVITISDDFACYLRNEFSLPDQTIYVIENWGPLADICPADKDNSWSRKNDLTGRKVVLYSGTLGLKHDGAQILALAANFGGDPEVVIVVASEGPGAAAIKNGAAKLGLSNVLVLGFQPFDVYQNVLASADILLAMISLDASEYSVPSKVLSYLCAERAIVLCAPRQNLAARIVEFAEAGLVSLPGDQDALAANVRLLLENPERRAAYGERGRAYASATFDIGVIGQRFLSVISAAVRKSDEGKSAASAGASPNTLRQHELS